MLSALRWRRSPHRHPQIWTSDNGFAPRSSDASSAAHHFRRRRARVRPDDAAPLSTANAVRADDSWQAAVLLGRPSAAMCQYSTEFGSETKKVGWAWHIAALGLPNNTAA